MKLRYFQKQMHRRVYIFLYRDEKRIDDATATTTPSPLFGNIMFASEMQHVDVMEFDYH